MGVPESMFFGQITKMHRYTHGLFLTMMLSRKDTWCDSICDQFQELGFQKKDCRALAVLHQQIPNKTRPQTSDELKTKMENYYRRRGEHDNIQSRLITSHNQTQIVRGYTEKSLGELGFLGKNPIPNPINKVVGIIPGSLEKRFGKRSALAEEYDREIHSLKNLILVTGHRVLKPEECTNIKQAGLRTELECLKQRARYFTAQSSIDVQVFNASIHQEHYEKVRANIRDNAIELADYMLSNREYFENTSLVFFIEPPFGIRMIETFKMTLQEKGIDIPCFLYSGRNQSFVSDELLASAGNELIGMMYHFDSMKQQQRSIQP